MKLKVKRFAQKLENENKVAYPKNWLKKLKLK